MSSRAQRSTKWCAADPGPINPGGETGIHSSRLSVRSAGMTACGMAQVPRIAPPPRRPRVMCFLIHLSNSPAPLGAHTSSKPKAVIPAERSERRDPCVPVSPPGFMGPGSAAHHTCKMPEIGWRRRPVCCAAPGMTAFGLGMGFLIAPPPRCRDAGAHLRVFSPSLDRREGAERRSAHPGNKHAWRGVRAQ